MIVETPVWFTASLFVSLRGIWVSHKRGDTKISHMILCRVVNLRSWHAWTLVLRRQEHLVCRPSKVKIPINVRNIASFPFWGSTENEGHPAVQYHTQISHSEVHMRGTFNPQWSVCWFNDYFLSMWMLKSKILTRVSGFYTWKRYVIAKTQKLIDTNYYYCSWLGPPMRTQKNNLSINWESYDRSETSDENTLLGSSNWCWVSFCIDIFGRLFLKKR